MKCTWSDAHLRNTSQYITQICSGIVVGFGIIALLGWVSGLHLLASIRTNYIPMAPNTAIIFIALGCTLFSLARWPTHCIVHWFAKIVTIFDLLLGFLTLVQRLSNINFGTDSFLFSTTKTLGNIPIGYMSYITALNFLLAGFSLLLLVFFSLNERRMRNIASGLAIVVVTIGFVVILGYLYSTPLLYGGTTVPMALTTAFAFVSLGIGLLITTAGSDYWLLHLVAGTSTRVRLMRAFLPITAFMVLLSGWLNTTICSQSRGNPALISALLAILSIIVTGSIISYIANIIGGTIDRTNNERILSQERLKDEITQHKLTEKKLFDTNAILLTIKNINSSLLISKNETALFREVCRLLLNVKFIKAVWIGITEKGSFDIKPIAQAGLGEQFLSSVKLKWDDSDYGIFPPGIVIKTGHPVVINEIEGNTTLCKSCRESVLKINCVCCMSVPLKHNEDTIGVLNVYSDKNDAFGKSEVEFLMEVVMDISIGIKSLRLEKYLELSLENLRKTLNETIKAIALMVELRDPYTSGHERRVSQLACAIASELGFTEDQIEGIRVSAFLHDIGKIVIPAEILSKPSRLNEYEFGIIKRHAEVGYDILKGLELPWPVALAIFQHHEALNGTGYPSGIKNGEIILEARILTVADVVEAIASHRPYRPALGINKALEEIMQKRNILYDPDAVDACVRLFKETGFKFED